MSVSITPCRGFNNIRMAHYRCYTRYKQYAYRLRAPDHEIGNMRTGTCKRAKKIPPDREQDFIGDNGFYFFNLYVIIFQTILRLRI